MGKVIAVFNQKGGVGKTTTNVNLSACIAKNGKKVCVIDIDPQGNTTSGFGVDKNTLEYTSYDIILGNANIKDVIVHTEFDNLDLIPSSVELAGAEIELTNMKNRETRLKQAINEIKEDYDYIFIDCP
ncbi:MAG: AAA family ATPase, partial [Natronincolaceae bacterium]